MAIAYPRPTTARSVLRSDAIREMVRRLPQAPAFERLASAYDLVLGQHERIAQDTTHNDDFKLVAKARATRKALDPAMTGLQQLRADLIADRAQREQRLGELFKPKSYEDTMVASELRFHLRGLPSGERLSVLRAAMAAGDKDVLRAVAIAPAMLSDLPAEMHAQARSAFVNLHPEQAQDADALKQIDSRLEAVDLLERTVAQSIGNAVDFVKADSIAQMAQAAAAE